MKEILETMDWKMVGAGGLIGWFTAGNPAAFILTMVGWLVYCFLIDQWKAKIRLEKQNELVEQAVIRISESVK